jgi:ribosomal protein L40E
VQWAKHKINDGTARALCQIIIARLQSSWYGEITIKEIKDAYRCTSSLVSYASPFADKPAEADQQPVRMSRSSSTVASSSSSSSSSSSNRSRSEVKGLPSDASVEETSALLSTMSIGGGEPVKVLSGYQTIATMTKLERRAMKALLLPWVCRSCGVQNPASATIKCVECAVPRPAWNGSDHVNEGAVEEDDEMDGEDGDDDGFSRKKKAVKKSIRIKAPEPATAVSESKSAPSAPGGPVVRSSSVVPPPASAAVAPKLVDISLASLLPYCDSIINLSADMLNQLSSLLPDVAGANVIREGGYEWMELGLIDNNNVITFIVHSILDRLANLPLDGNQV